MLNKKKLLIISVSGIGNTIMQSPLIVSICKSNQYDVDVLFGNKAMADIFNSSGLINETYCLPTGLIEKIKLIKKLRQNRYSTSVACFPSNRIQFHLLPVLLGIANRVSHDYGKTGYVSMNILSNNRVIADPALHDVEQNLALLNSLEIAKSARHPELFFSITDENKRFAEQLMGDFGEGKQHVIGIHAGCKRTESFKRWPKEHFVELIDELNSKNMSCLLFAGPDEKEEVYGIYKDLKVKEFNMLVEEGSINNIGATISVCDAFLSTDSGLGHIAAAVKTPTLAIFGPAQHTRAAPYGKYGNYVRLGIDCSPCSKYPFESSSSKINCPYDYKCLKNLEVKKVCNELLALL